ncbi:hypothetical protein ACCUM_3426 [Candidatus Accumulibacter phosphatis]|uniref:Uncharacterized protein n=1 Tax=Candidatus Accumulibacter phosphatis TaxID=327160 RepID=A0A5S4EP48_9PROT|nr:hypothetical protein ACCUM_3426 [Candidatus Accumulibacter phosphatis]
MSEGIGIFIGIVAWDVLRAGEMELLKASLIAATGALIWYGARCWLSRRKHRGSL